MRHPEIIFKTDNCIDKTCSDRHPKPCKHFKTGSCKFRVSCEFTHEKSVEMEQKETEDVKEDNLDSKTEGTNKNEDNYVDYDKINSDGENRVETYDTVECQQWDYTPITKGNLTKHEKGDILPENICLVGKGTSCMKCDAVKNVRFSDEISIKMTDRSVSYTHLTLPTKRIV